MKLFVRMIMLATTLGPLSSCYLLQQAGPFLKNRSEAEDVEFLLGNGEIDPATRDFLTLTQEILDFAHHELGLAESGNYRKYVYTGKDYLVDVVSASEALKFEDFTWWFPFVGRVPYKGFYKQEAAIREAEKLKARDLDVLVRKVDGFSSLGYFHDPLFSFMGKYSVSRIAELIIHEETHATIWVKGSTRFNEEVATFVGQQGALMFLRMKYGEESPEVERTRELRQDGETFRILLFELAGVLTEMYESDLPEEKKYLRKEELIEEFRQEFAKGYEERFLTDAYSWFSEFKVNNAFVNLYRLYSGEPELYRDICHCLGDDLPAAIEVFKTAALERKGAKEWLREYLGNCD
ncbi:MAG: aminopeptidase [Spirochaetales bacterium]|nr:aminopeptidase [Spirochaetales bacterium]